MVHKTFLSCRRLRGGCGSLGGLFAFSSRRPWYKIVDVAFDDPSIIATSLDLRKVNAFVLGKFFGKRGSFDATTFCGGSGSST